MRVPKTLVEYPYVVVRIRCSMCRRNGEYRLARLAMRYGADIPLDELLSSMAGDCPWRTQRTLPVAKRIVPHCGAHFPDLERPRSPDLPPGAMPLRVVQGGKG